MGMSTIDMRALVSLVSQGRRLRHLTELDLSKNNDISNQDVAALARAIDVHGLPLLTKFKLIGLNTDKVTLFGISAIALAVITRCPKLKYICLTCAGPDDVYNEMVMGMLAAAGREGKVKVGGEVPVDEAEDGDEEDVD